MINSRNHEFGTGSNRDRLFVAIYSTCRKSIECLARSSMSGVGAECDSGDIVQVVFARFHQALSKAAFPSVTVQNWKNKENLLAIRSWLFAATLNVAREFARKQRKQASIRRDRLSALSGTDDSARLQILDLLLNEAIERCSPMEKCVMTMRVNSYSCREISEILGRSPSTIRGHLMSARNRISNWLND